VQTMKQRLTPRFTNGVLELHNQEPLDGGLLVQFLFLQLILGPFHYLQLLWYFLLVACC
jgi:hypothetical protein